MAEVLYISYDGLLEPLGQSQVLPYLRRLAKRHRITIVSFEKPLDWIDLARRTALQIDVQSANIEWHPLPYHKKPSLIATAWDVARGISLCRSLVREHGIRVVHARSYVASLIALHLKQHLKLAYLFDMRGFWPDEKVDAGTWSSASPVYHLAKSYERRFLMSADAVVSLTDAGVAAMRRFTYLRGRDIDFTVIPTCADLDRFVPREPARTGPFTLGYLGNAGGWYRFEPVAAAFEAIRKRRPDARMLIANHGQHNLIQGHLAAQGVPSRSVDILKVDFIDVPNVISRMDATAFFIEPTFSKQASAPTRLAEFMACGVPCLINDGVGDTGRIVRDAGAGVVIDKISNAAAADGALQLLMIANDPVVRESCIATALRHFSLDSGVEAYDALYRRLSKED